VNVGPLPPSTQFSGPSFYSVSYTAISGDTTTTIATALKNLLNASVPSAVATFTSSAAVITATSGTLGNTVPLSASVSPASGSNAFGTVTVAGTFGAGRALSIVIGNPAGGGTTTINYTTTAADTTATLLAASLVAAINASQAVQGPAAPAYTPNGTPSIQAAYNTAGVIYLLSAVSGTSPQSLAATGAGGTTLTASGVTFTGGSSTQTLTLSANDIDMVATADPITTSAYAGVDGAHTLYQGMPVDLDPGTKSLAKSNSQV
jgi:hypothetical protein